MAYPKFLVDPNDVAAGEVFENGSFKQEEFIQYVELTVFSRGRSVVNQQRNTFSSDGADLKVNFAGFNARTNSYTTDYTAYVAAGEGQEEGFGMTNIQISLTPSMMPQVTIQFVDVRGMAMLNQSEDSPFRVLLETPPPVYTLKVKGYYGKVVRMQLHPVRNTAVNFNAETGNAEFTLELIGSAYAPLTSVVSKYLLALPFYESKPLPSPESLKAGTKPKSYYEFLLRSRMLMDNQKSITQDDKLVRTIVEAESAMQERENIIEEIRQVRQRYFSTDNRVSVTFSPVEEDLMLEKVNFSTVNEDFSDLLQQVYQLKKQWEQKYEMFTGKPLVIRAQEQGQGDVRQVSLDISELYGYLQRSRGELAEEKSSAEDQVEEQLNQLSITTLGAIPTAGFIFEVICKDIEKFFALLMDVSQQAEQHHANPNVLAQFNRNNVSAQENKLFPWPAVYQPGGNRSDGGTAAAVEVYPGSVDEFKDWPEVRFVERMVAAMLEHQMYDQHSAADTLRSGNRSQDSGQYRQYLPFSPALSTLSGYHAPFYKKKQQEIVEQLMLRFIALDHGWDLEGKPPEITRHFAQAEAYNLLTNLRDTKLRSRWKVIADTYQDQSLLEYLNDHRGGEVTTLALDLYEGTNFDTSQVTLPGAGSLAASRTDGNFMGITQVGTQKPVLLTSRRDRNPVERFVREQNRYLAPFQPKSGQTSPEITQYYNLFFPDGQLSPYSSEFVPEFDAYLMLLCEPGRSERLRSTDKMTQAFLLSVLPWDERANRNPSLSRYNDLPRFGVRHFFRPEIAYKFRHPGIVEVPRIALISMGAWVYYHEHEDFKQKVNEALGWADNPLDVEINNISVADRQFLMGQFETFVNSADYNQVFAAYGHLLNLDMDSINQGDIFSDREAIHQANYQQLAEELDMYRNGFEPLFEPLYLQNETYKTFSADITPVHQPVSVNGRADLYFRVFLQTVASELENPGREGVSRQNDRGGGTVKNVLEDDDIKLTTYRAFKAIYDRWLAGRTGEVRTVKDNDGEMYRAFFPFIYNREDRLVDQFRFVDRGHNDIRDSCILDLSPYLEYGANPETNLYALMADSLGRNQFLFYPFLAYIPFRGEEWKAAFRLTTDVSDEATANPAFVAIYTGGLSEVLDQRDNGYRNDGHNLTDPEDTQSFNHDQVRAFRLSYGKQNQAMFTNLSLSTEEHGETRETFMMMDRILQREAATPVAKSQNLYNIYSQRSYTCGFRSMGNMCIQPTQYFQLENIPMFAGSYLIHEVQHTLTPEGAFTEGKGVRIRKYPLPFVQKVTTMLDVNLEEVKSDYQRTQQLSEGESQGQDEAPLSSYQVFDITTGEGIRDNYNGPATVSGRLQAVIAENRENLKFGVQGGYCQRWLRLMLAKIDIRFTAAYPDSWEFFTGIPLNQLIIFDRRLSSLEQFRDAEPGLIPADGESKDSFFTNEDLQRMGTPEGSIVFGHSLGSAYLDEAYNFYMSYRTEAAKGMMEGVQLSSVAKERGYLLNPVTHVGLFVQGEMINLVGNRDHGHLIYNPPSRFCPVACLPL